MTPKLDELWAWTHGILRELRGIASAVERELAILALYDQLEAAACVAESEGERLRLVASAAALSTVLFAVARVKAGDADGAVQLLERARYWLARAGPQEPSEKHRKDQVAGGDQWKPL